MAYGTKMERQGAKLNRFINRQKKLLKDATKKRTAKKKTVKKRKTRKA